NGSDGESGLNTSSGVVERSSAPLAAGNCGTFGSWTTVTLVGGADTSVVSGNCYRYRYTISDRVGNQSTPSAASATAKVDATTSGDSRNDGYGLDWRAGSIEFWVNGSSNTVSTPVTTGQWTHIAGTYDGTTLSLYKNGQLAASLALSGAIGHSTSPLAIGGGW